MAKRSVKPVIVGILLAALAGTMPAQAQDDLACETFSKSIYDTNGDEVERTPPEATFTAYLNRDSSRLVTDQTTRCSGSTFSGGGRIFVPVGRFQGVSEGDSVFVRFTDTVAGERGSLGGEVGNENPIRQIYLSEASFPERPQVTLSVDEESGARTLSWEAESGLTYQVYRRALEDVLANKTRGVLRRVASGLTDGQFVDEDDSSDSTYAYIVYAQDQEGAYSSRSEEVVEPQGIPDLRVVSTSARNVTLRWGAIGSVPVADSVGYNVYRRAEGGSYGDTPIGYTGLRDARGGRQYTDTRLQPGQTYYYKVRARTNRVSDDRYQEYGESQEIAVTTASSTEGTYTYANLDVAVVIFRNSSCRESLNCNRYQIGDKQYRDLKFMFEQARDFYWRGSQMKLNLNYTFYPVEEYVDFGEGGSNSSADQTGEYLRDHFGVTKRQYEIVYMINAGTGGNHSFGTRGNDLLLPGPDRGPSGSVAYSHHPVPRGGGFFDDGVHYPDRVVGTNHIWLVTHEGQHAIDAIYGDNGQPQMGHGDIPELYGNPEIQNNDFGTNTGEPPGYGGFPENYPPEYPEGYGERFGKRFDFQAAMLRDFHEQHQAFEKLQPEWGDIYETTDEDGDGVPDQDTLVTLDEARFGSSTSEADTDGDGYTDRQEVLDGFYPTSYATSDPTDSDTDGDGVPDGQDKYPRYFGDTLVVEAEEFQPAIDADLSEWPAGALVSQGVTAQTGDEDFSPEVYMAYTRDSLYMAMELGTVAIPEVRFDLGADGRWYGAGNTELTFDISNERLQRVRSWDARDDVQRYLIEEEGHGSGDGLWDVSTTYQREFSRRVFRGSDLRVAVDLDFPENVRIEIAIPKNEDAGLSLQPGEDVGFYVKYGKVNNKSGARATAFDPWSYAYMTLEGEPVANSPQPGTVRKSYLQSNYPNPFREQTTFEYAVREAGQVRLAVYDLLGRRVATLVEEEKAPGVYTIAWDGRDGSGEPVASGVYVGRLVTPGGQQHVEKMTILR